MRRARRQIENLAGADRQLAALAVVLHAQDHFTLELIEELGTFVPVEIGARVGTTDDHDDEVTVDDAHVAHRRLQQVPVFVDPALQVEGWREGHGDIQIVRSGSTLWSGHAGDRSRVARSYTSKEARSPFSSSHVRRSDARFLASSMSINFEVASPSSIVNCTSRRVSGSMVDSRNCAGFISPRPLKRVTLTAPLIFSRSMRFSSASRSDSSRQ